jgi:hypothetical protein
MDTPKSSPKNNVSEEEIALQVQDFLTTWEFKVLSSPAGKSFKHDQVMSSALELLALNGVPLDKEEIALMVSMHESTLVPLLADKIPVELRDNFELLTQQLFIMLNTAFSVRSALDTGGNLAQVMEKSDDDRMLQLVLKKAVVQASQEVAKLQRCSSSWTKAADKRLDALSKASLYAEEARQRLVATEMQLQQYTSDTKAKSKQALLGFANGNDTAVLKSTFAAWTGEWLANKETRVLRQKYENELQEAEALLYKHQEKQLAGVRQMMMSKVRETDRGLVDFCISTWYDVVKGIKRDGDTKAELEALQAKMAGFHTDAKSRQMKVFGRMAGDRDQAVVVLAMSSWVTFHQEYHKEKEHEEAVKKAQTALNEHLKGKKDETKKLLNKMSASTDSGLVAQVWNAWLITHDEEKKARQLEEQMKSSDVKLKAMLANTKGKAFGVASRTNEQINENLLLRVLSAWMIEFKVAHVEKYYEKKISGKRQQLSKVHTLFKDFANQLESGLKTNDGDSSGRTGRRTTEGRKFVKDSGSVSLPDIHQRPQVV